MALTGEQRDPQGQRNFYYLRARYYDPATGRFLSQDPLPAGNLYAYVGNNPANRTDPTGMRWMTDKEGGAQARGGLILYNLCLPQVTSMCFLITELPEPVPCANLAPGQNAFQCRPGGFGTGGGEGGCDLNCIGNVLKVLDVLPLQLVDPKIAIAIDVAAGVVTEIQIISSDCDTGQKVETSIANAANVYFGVGGAPQGFVIETTTYLYINGTLATC